MIQDRLPQIPTADQLDQKAEWFGSLILTSTLPHERQPIVDYGCRLVAGVEPTTGQTLRFLNCLKTLAPNLPGYGRYIARISLNHEHISRFQRAIARRVAEGEIEWTNW